MQKIVIKTTNVNDEKPKQIVAAKYINVQWKIEEKKMNKALTEPDEDGKNFLGAFERIYNTDSVNGYLCVRCLQKKQQINGNSDQYENVSSLCCNKYKWTKDEKHFSLEDQKTAIVMQELSLKFINGLPQFLIKLKFNNLRILTLTNATLSKNEYMCMMEAKSISELDILNSTVTNMDMADILKTVPNVIRFICLLNRKDIIKNDTVKKLTMLPTFVQLKYFELDNIRNEIDLKTLGEVILKHKNVQFHLNFYGSEKYLEKINVTEKIIRKKLSKKHQLKIKKLIC